jgi:hypothetical protein
MKHATADICHTHNCNVGIERNLAGVDRVCTMAEHASQQANA